MNKEDGWLVLDKPSGLSSNLALQRIRRFLGNVKAGHGGTLDPLASGVLPIALGEATKTVSYCVDTTKTYTFTVRWGEERDTDDAEGAPTRSSPNVPSEEEIRAILPTFIGNISQVPPLYSAIKVGGARAYKAARQGKPLTLEPRFVNISQLTLVSSDGDGTSTFQISCGKGTYVRSVARDLGRAMNSAAYVTQLRRQAVGRFTLSEAHTLEKILAMKDMFDVKPLLESVDVVLDDIPVLVFEDNEIKRLRQGQRLQITRNTLCTFADQGTPVRCYDRKNMLHAIALVKDGMVSVSRVFNLDKGVK